MIPNRASPASTSRIKLLGPRMIFQRQIALTAILASFASPSLSAMKSKSIDRDDGRGDPTIYVHQNEGAYSYTSFNGKKQVVTLTCDTELKDLREPIVCARVFKYKNSFTTTHYVIRAMKDLTVLYVSDFSENVASVGLPMKNISSFDEFRVTCSF